MERGACGSGGGKCRFHPTSTSRFVNPLVHIDLCNIGCGGGGGINFSSHHVTDNAFASDGAGALETTAYSFCSSTPSCFATRKLSSGSNDTSPSL